MTWQVGSQYQTFEEWAPKGVKYRANSFNTRHVGHDFMLSFAERNPWIARFHQSWENILYPETFPCRLRVCATVWCWGEYTLTWIIVEHCRREGKNSVNYKKHPPSSPPASPCFCKPFLCFGEPYTNFDLNIHHTYNNYYAVDWAKNNFRTSQKNLNYTWNGSQKCFKY